LVSLTDPDGNVVASTSSGTAGFRGSRKGTAFAAQRAAEQAARRGVDMGMRNIDVYIKGPGAGREPAIRALQGAGLNVSSIRDVTPIPHNGVRPPKRRRV
jgi:small subunit ribosomal protein S11